MKKNTNKVLIIVLIVTVIIGLNYVIHIYEKIFLNLKAYGYIGIFLACLFLNATVLMPSSSTVVVMSMASIYNPVITALIGAVGSSIGEFTGYFTGYYGCGVIKNSLIVNKIMVIYQKFPRLAILIFAILPLPFFDVLGILAGSVKMEKRIFFILCLIGKAIKMLMYAYLGVYATGYLKKL